MRVREERVLRVKGDDFEREAVAEMKLRVLDGLKVRVFLRVEKDEVVG